MEYRNLEDRLVKLHMIDDEGMGAFKGRLRVFRDMGVPNKPSVGSGKRQIFNKADLFEVHLALTLSELGLPPSRIVTTIRCVRMSRLFDRVSKIDDERWLIVVAQSNVGRKTGELKSFPVVTVDFRFDELPAAMKRFEAEMPVPVWQSAINVSRLVRDIQGIG